MRHGPISVALAAAALCCGAAASGAAHAAPCVPVGYAGDLAVLPPDWQRAVEAVIQSTSEEGQPWSCPGGRFDLSLAQDGAMWLQLHDGKGRVASRSIPSAALLLPMAKALLAAPPEWTQPAPAPATAPVPAPPVGGPPPRGIEPAPPLDPSPIRALADASVGARYTAPSRSLWGLASVRISVPFGAWSGAIWFRGALPAPLDRTPPRFSGTDVSIGLSGARRLLPSPVELWLSLEPSVAVVSMRAGAEPNLLEGSRLAFRVGLSLRAYRVLGERVRAFVGLEGETEPAGWAAPHQIDPALPSLPVAGAGLSLGIQAVVR